MQARFYPTCLAYPDRMAKRTRLTWLRMLQQSLRQQSSRRSGSGINMVPSFVRVMSGNDSDFSSPANSSNDLASSRCAAGRLRAQDAEPAAPLVHHHLRSNAAPGCPLAVQPPGTPTRCATRRGAARSPAPRRPLLPPPAPAKVALAHLPQRLGCTRDGGRGSCTTLRCLDQQWGVWLAARAWHAWARFGAQAGPPAGPAAALAR
eukprot:107421-Chlamydomonas_euryale.AAC.14